MTGQGQKIEKSERTLAREAFFIDFARETRKRFPNLVLMLTGGFRSRTGAESAVQTQACDLVGIARPAAVDPKFSQLLLDETVPDDEAQMFLSRVPLPGLIKWLDIKAIGAGAESVS